MPAVPALFDHPLWPTLLRFLYLDCDNGVNGPRHRIEVAKAAPRTLLDMVVACAYCHRPIHPVRETQRRVWTLNHACPLAQRYSCARQRATRAQAEAVRTAMGLRSRASRG